MRNGRGVSGLLWLAGGVAAGTAIGWLTAPRRGDWVRNQTRQKLDHWYRTGVRRMRKRGRDLENRVHGGVAEIREVWSGREHYVDANTLTDQVHSAVGREFAEILPHINLNAVGHTIYLHGYVHEAEQRERLIEAIRAVDGVDDVSASELRVQPAPELPEGPAIVPETDVREASAPAPGATRRKRSPSTPS